MPNKSLGQHWLKDREILAYIADGADLNSNDTVLEIGPGLGTLTSELLRRAQHVVAVEFDAELARKLPGQFPGKSLEVINDDILHFDLRALPPDYKVVANIPYYITGKIIDRLLASEYKPVVAALLVQKEVAERLAAGPGAMSLVALNAQIYAEVSLGAVVNREYFTPAPEVDSQVVILRRRSASLVTEADQKDFWHLVRAGFASRRKKLRSSLAAGLRLTKSEIEAMLQRAAIDPDLRAQDLSIADWLRLMGVFKES